MRALHRASRRRPRGARDALLRRFPALSELCDRARAWLALLRGARDELRRRLERLAAQDSRRRRLQPGPPRERWTAFDDADHAYVRALALADPRGSETPPEPSAAPSLLPAFRGSFSRLLRRGGVAADEDEAREAAAVSDDLRGVGRAPLTLRRARPQR